MLSTALCQASLVLSSLPLRHHHCTASLLFPGTPVVEASGCQATPVTRSACALMVSCFCSEGMAQTLSVPLHAPVASCEPSGEKQQPTMGRSSPISDACSLGCAEREGRAGFLVECRGGALSHRSLMGTLAWATTSLQTHTPYPPGWS